VKAALNILYREYFTTSYGIGLQEVMLVNIVKAKALLCLD
jgi:hypothetical protein